MRKLLFVLIAVAGTAVLFSSLASERPRPKGEGLRLVALAPSLCETVFALGAGDTLVGVTDFCDRPPEAKYIPSVGSMIAPSLEKIVMLRPDYVLVTRGGGNRMETAEALRRAGVKMLVADDSDIDGLKEAFRLIGLVTCREEKAEELCAELDRALARAAEAARLWKGRRALWIVGTEPLFAAGRGTLHDDITERLGLRNALAARGWREISLEWLLLHPPDVLFDISGTGEEWWEDRFGETDWPTVRLELPQDDLARPGPFLARGLVELAEALREVSPCR